MRTTTSVRERNGSVMAEDIVVLEGPIETVELVRLVSLFSDMVKYVVDVEQERIAVGGNMHADSEHVLLDLGSRQADLWGANYYPGRGAAECIEYTSLINIRPADGNPGMEIQDEAIRTRVHDLTLAWIGRGEPLP